MGVARRHPLPLHPRRLRFARGLPCRLPLDLDGFPRRWNFLPPRRPLAILDRDIPVPPFAHQHLALCGRTVAALRRQLEPSIAVSPDPVVADRALVLQTKNPVQFHRPRRATMVVLPLRRRPQTDNCVPADTPSPNTHSLLGDWRFPSALAFSPVGHGNAIRTAPEVAMMDKIAHSHEMIKTRRVRYQV
jgi:hypothetical protein